MANVIVEVGKPITDGSKLKFRTPCDSSTIDYLEVKYPANNGVGTLVKKFVFKDAHGTELSGVGNLFVGGVLIEVLLDVTHGVAYIKNADTNSYVESVKSDVQRLEEKQKQFLESVGKTVKECENIATSADGFAQAMEDATERANSVKGVYVGSGPMPEGYNIQIDPEGEVLTMDKTIKSDSVNPVENKAIYSALEKKADVNTTVYTYKSLNVLGITEGQETIEEIANKMQRNTMLMYTVGEKNADIYPHKPAYGLVRVTYLELYRALFEYTSKFSGTSWVGFYSSTNDPKWSGWVQTATLGDIDAVRSELSAVKKDVSTIKSSNGITDSALQNIIEHYDKLEAKVYSLEIKAPNTDNALANTILEVNTLNERVNLLAEKVAILENK